MLVGVCVMCVKLPGRVQNGLALTPVVTAVLRTKADLRLRVPSSATHGDAH